MNNRNIKYLLVVLAAIGIITVSSSLAFFTSTVNTLNNGDTSISTRDIGSITYTGIFALNTTDFYPGSIGLTKFTIEKNTPTGTGYYEIDLDSVVDLAYQKDIEISLYKTTNEVNNNISVTEGSISNANNQYVKNDTLVINGTPELVYGPKVLKTASSLVLEQTAFDCETLQTTTYYLVYKYKNNGNQNSQQGKTFTSEVSVRLIDSLSNTEETEPNAPELATAMVPIYYDGTTMKVADTSSEWYNYSDHEWANAVLVNVSDNDIKNKYFNNDMSLKTTAVGQTVDMSEVQQMYVWIPRYRYQLWNAENGSSDPQAINIVFEDKNTLKSTGNQNGDWLTHPAFTFGSEELNGIWVGKFENSGSTSNITIKPNMASLASLNVSTMFNATRAVESSSLLGLNANQIDSHMMKDTEWGAVAYLYSSIYGTYNADKSCIARGCEVWINNVSSNGDWDGTKYTGCAAQGVSTATITGTACESGRGWDGAGVNASTTGNMYGIYDMSGGNWEYTMSVMLDSNSIPIIGESGFVSMPNSKYYNTYPYGTIYTDHARGTIGTATKEILKKFGRDPGGWNRDRSGLVCSSYAWAVRGGYANDTTDAGVFAFNYYEGDARSHIGFRLVLDLTA